MSRPLATLSLAAALGVAALGAVALDVRGAAAQARRPVPIEQDLARYERLEDRLDRRGTGSVGRVYAPLPGSGTAAPDVPGFDGPPGGILRDTVGNSGPLPPGSIVNSGNE